MKYLLYLCSIAIVSSKSLLRYETDARLQQLLVSSTVDELKNNTLHLILDTVEEMSRLKQSGQGQINSTWTVIQNDLGSTKNHSLAEAQAIVDYITDQIGSLSEQAAGVDITECNIILPQVTVMPSTNAEQIKVALATLMSSANSKLNGKYSEWASLIGLVQGLKTTLAACNEESLCIIKVADNVVEYNLKLMDGVNDMPTVLPNLRNQTSTYALSEVKTTLNIFEDYVCNIGRIIEDCINAKIQEAPDASTTSASTLPTTAGTTRTTTAGTASTPNPRKYCGR